MSDAERKSTIMAARKRIGLYCKYLNEPLLKTFAKSLKGSVGSSNEVNRIFYYVSQNKQRLEIEKVLKERQRFIEYFNLVFFEGIGEAKIKLSAISAIREVRSLIQFNTFLEGGSIGKSRDLTLLNKLLTGVKKEIERHVSKEVKERICRNIYDTPNIRETMLKLKQSVAIDSYFETIIEHFGGVMSTNCKNPKTYNTFVAALILRTILLQGFKGADLNQLTVDAFVQRDKLSNGTFNIRINHDRDLVIDAKELELFEIYLAKFRPNRECLKKNRDQLFLNINGSILKLTSIMYSLQCSLLGIESPISCSQIVEASTSTSSFPPPSGPYNSNLSRKVIIKNVVQNLKKSLNIESNDALPRVSQIRFELSQNYPTYDLNKSSFVSKIFFSYLNVYIDIRASKYLSMKGFLRIKQIAKSSLIKQLISNKNTSKWKAKDQISKNILRKVKKFLTSSSSSSSSSCGLTSTILTMNSDLCLILPHIQKQDWKLLTGLTVKYGFEGRGRGLFSAAFIAKNQVVCDYHGTLVAKTTKKYIKDALSTNYVFEFRKGSRHILIDAIEEDHSVGRLMNHSFCCANVTPKVVYTQRPYVLFVSTKDINPDEELLWTYALDNTTTSWDCPKCGKSGVKFAKLNN